MAGPRREAAERHRVGRPRTDLDCASGERDYDENLDDFSAHVDAMRRMADKAGPRQPRVHGLGPGRRPRHRICHLCVGKATRVRMGAAQWVVGQREGSTT